MREDQHYHRVCNIVLLRYTEIYENTEILSPIDTETWQLIGEACNLDPASRVIELASGKGAFAGYLAKNFNCRVECFEIDPDFVAHSVRRASELDLSSRLEFQCCDVNSLRVEREAYDLGVCLGSLYLFRESGWRVLMEAVRGSGYVAVSDLVCKNPPPPRELQEVFFEETGQPLTLEDARRWYISRGVRILHEVECSRGAWLRYYDLLDEMLSVLGHKHESDRERLAEIGSARAEGRLARKHVPEHLGYFAFVMQKV